MLESQSPRYCFSTEDYRDAMHDFYSSNNIIEEEITPDWFYLPYCDEGEKYREFIDNKCSHHRIHRLLIRCNCCQNEFTTFNTREKRCSVRCRSIERKLKTYTDEKLKKLANVYNIRRRRKKYVIDELVQKVEMYII